MQLPRRWIVVIAIVVVAAGAFGIWRYTEWQNDRFVRDEMKEVVEVLRTTTLVEGNEKWAPQDISFVVDDRGKRWLVRYTGTIEVRYAHEFTDAEGDRTRIENVDLDVYYSQGIGDKEVKWRLVRSRNPDFAADEFGPESFFYDEFKRLIDGHP